MNLKGKGRSQLQEVTSDLSDTGETEKRVEQNQRGRKNGITTEREREREKGTYRQYLTCNIDFEADLY